MSQQEYQIDNHRNKVRDKNIKIQSKGPNTLHNKSKSPMCVFPFNLIANLGTKTRRNVN